MARLGKTVPGAACVWQNCRMQPPGDGSWTYPWRPSHAQFVFLWAGKPRPPFRHRCPRARDPPTSYCGCGAVLPREVCQKSAGRTLPAGPQPVRPDSDPYRDARHPARRARPKPPYAGRVADIQDDVPASRTSRAPLCTSVGCVPGVKVGKQAPALRLHRSGVASHGAQASDIPDARSRIVAVAPRVRGK